MVLAPVLKSPFGAVSSAGGFNPAEVVLAGGYDPNNFVVNVPSAFDYARTSVATFRDRTGILQTAAVDVPRYYYPNFKTTAPRTVTQPGWLSEVSRINFALRSNDYSNAVWTKLNCTVAQDETGPDDAANTGWSITDDATNDRHGLQQTYTTASDLYVTMSFFVKPGTLNFCRLESDDANQFAMFDLANGTIGDTGGTGFIYAGIEPYSNGWFRAWLSTLEQNAGTALMGVYSATGDSDGDEVYVGAGADAMGAFGAQVELDYHTSYIDVLGVVLTRSQDQFSILTAGLFDQQGVSQNIYLETTALWDQIENQLDLYLTGVTGGAGANLLTALRDHNINPKDLTLATTDSSESTRFRRRILTDLQYGDRLVVRMGHKQGLMDDRADLNGVDIGKATTVSGTGDDMWSQTPDEIRFWSPAGVLQSSQIIHRFEISA